MEPRGLNTHMSKLCKRTGLPHLGSHALRHTAATMACVDTTVIALWLGHESPTSTRVYLHADMALKQQAITRTAPPGTVSARYQPTDALLAFLDAL